MWTLHMTVHILVTDVISVVSTLMSVVSHIDKI